MVGQGQTEGVDGGLDQGLAGEVISSVWIFQSRADKIVDWIWRKRGVRDY